MRLILLISATLICFADSSAFAESSVTVWRNHIIVTAPSHGDNKQLGLRMQQLVTVDFEDTTLDDAIDFLHRHTKINFIIGSDIRADMPNISLKLNNVPMSTVLIWVKRLADVNYHLVDNVIYFTNKPLRGHEKTVMYDVASLAMPIQDFPGPELSLTGTSTNFVFGEADAEAREGTSVEELADIVREQILD